VVLAVGAVIEAACKFPGVFEIAVGNFEGRLRACLFDLHEILG